MHRVYRDIHKLSLAVDCDAEDAAGLVDRRLAAFPAATAQSPDLVVEIATGARLPAVERPDDSRVVHETADASVSYSDALDELWVEYGAHGVACCRAGAGRAWIAVDRAADAWGWIATRPLLTICLLELLKRRSLYGIHAAGAALGPRAVLLFGPSGSGKSTISLSLLLARWSFLGDDIVFLRDAGERVEVLSFADEIDASDETIGFFPDLDPPREWPQLAGYPKRQLPPGALAATPAPPAAHPVVALLPHVAGGDAHSTEPITADTLFRELVSNVLLTHHAATQANLDVLARLARQATGFTLALGREIGSLPALLSDVLAKASGGDSGTFREIPYP